MNNETNEKLANYFRLIGHPLRVRLLKWLFEMEDKKDAPPCVPTMIASELEETLSQVSYHLNQMYLYGILNRKISGRYSFYGINKSCLDLMKEFLNASK